MNLIKAIHQIFRYASRFNPRLYIVTSDKKVKHNVALAAIVKNETPYIREWIEYHRIIGVEKFYIYDNESNDNLKQCLNSYILSGIVSYLPFNGKAVQMKAYQHAIKHYQRECRYIGFLDIDEFIVLTNKFKLIDILRTCENSNPNFGGLAVQWCEYGSSGHKMKPDGLVIESFLYHRSIENIKEKDVNSHIKTICNPRKVYNYGSCHFPTYKRNFTSYTTDNEEVKGAFVSGQHYDKVRINHYFTKSYEEFQLKCLRGRADNGLFRDIEREFKDRDKNEIYDDGLLRYVNEIKSALKNTSC